MLCAGSSEDLGARVRLHRVPFLDLEGPPCLWFGELHHSLHDVLSAQFQTPLPSSEPCSSAGTAGPTAVRYGAHWFSQGRISRSTYGLDSALATASYLSQDLLEAARRHAEFAIVLKFVLAIEMAGGCLGSGQVHGRGE